MKLFRLASLLQEKYEAGDALFLDFFAKMEKKYAAEKHPDEEFFDTEGLTPQELNEAKKTVNAPIDDPLYDSGFYKYIHRAMSLVEGDAMNDNFKQFAEAKSPIFPNPDSETYEKKANGGHKLVQQVNYLCKMLDHACGKTMSREDIVKINPKNIAGYLDQLNAILQSDEMYELMANSYFHYYKDFYVKWGKDRHNRTVSLHPLVPGSQNDSVTTKYAIHATHLFERTLTDLGNALSQASMILANVAESNELIKSPVPHNKSRGIDTMEPPGDRLASFFTNNTYLGRMKAAGVEMPFADIHEYHRYVSKDKQMGLPGESISHLMKVLWHSRSTRTSKSRLSDMVARILQRKHLIDQETVDTQRTLKERQEAKVFFDEKGIQHQKDKAIYDIKPSPATMSRFDALMKKYKEDLAKGVTAPNITKDETEMLGSEHMDWAKHMIEENE